jgi:tRNA pseudouridine55 synthase
MASDALHGLLIVDKAAGPTSHDVVGVARRALETREIGHTGTLDPMATGVLVLAIGEATKLVNALTASSKSYEATVQLGRSTSTLDAEGEVDGSAAVPALDLAHITEVASAFLGETEQRAPAVSAIKVAGKSLYKRARKGELFETPLRRVRLDSVVVNAVREGEIDLTLTCGSGFYVRALARDLALALGTLGHLSRLRRTHNGPFGLERAVTFDQLRAGRDDATARAALRGRVLPLADVCRGLPHGWLDAAGVLQARHGRPIAPSQFRDALDGRSGPSAGPLIALDDGGLPIALVERSGDGLRVLRGFRPL